MNTKSAIKAYSYKKYTEFRNSKNLRDADVSKSTGIYPSTFTDWKNLVSMPGVEKLYALAKFFGVTIEDFIPKDEVI